MNRKQSSTTAEGMALMRAIETSRPEGERICYDPIARSLVSGIKFFFSKLTIDSGLYAYFNPGTIEFIITRERYIDDFLRTGLRDGFYQVVILGAGFDTRPYRIAGIEKTRVFEVDHPSTQAEKLKRLNKVIDPLPGHVTFVPVDFNTQALAERLFASGYNAQVKTMFIWQGVTMYLTREGVDSTLAFIANHSGADSTVIFDYFYNETLYNLKMKTTRWILRLIGERMIFGIDEGQIGSFLTRRGFCDIGNADAEVLKRRYLTGSNAGRAISKGIAIASARVSRG